LGAGAHLGVKQTQGGKVYIFSCGKEEGEGLRECRRVIKPTSSQKEGGGEKKRMSLKYRVINKNDLVPL